jgi:single-strand DNA-binding protein
MNKVILMGRLTRDPETRYSQSAEPIAITRYCLAVDRRFKKEGAPTADFINCVAFRQAGEFANKYFKKGQRVLVEGSLQINTTEDPNGGRKYFTDVVVEQQYFADSKQDGMNRGGGEYDFAQNPPPVYGGRQGDGGMSANFSPAPAGGADTGAFMPIDESLDDEDLPF